jgi:NTP pyrophosphatase (non-canonical NTP hydrolase)
MTERLRDLEDLKHRLRRFAAERDWDRYHAPKNLAMALAGEVGELLEHFQWLTESESGTLPQTTMDEVELELADIMIYLVRLSDKLGIDLLKACRKKIHINARRYPARRVRGSNKKYDRYDAPE